MNCRRIIPILYCFSLLSITAFSQTDTLVFEPVNNPAVQQFVIRRMCTTKDGKLWLSTDKGVVSFDGNEINVFAHKDEDTTSLRFSSIMKCYPDSKGNLYVVTVGRGVDYLDTKTGRALHLNIQIPSKDSSRLPFPTPYYCIYPDEDDGSIWAGLTNFGLIHYNLQTRKTNYYFFDKNPDGTHKLIYSIQPDVMNKNLLWLGTENGIYLFNKNTKEFKRNFRCTNPKDSSQQDAAVIRMVVNHSDSIWFAVPRKGMGCYKIKSGYYTIYPQKKNNSNDITELYMNYLQYKDTDEFYIGSFDSLSGVFNIKTHKYSFASKTYQRLPSFNVDQILGDSAGNVWCSLWDHLYVAYPGNNKFTTFKVNNNYYKKNTTDAFSNVVWNSKTKNYYAAFDNSDGVFVLDSNLHFIRSVREEVLNQVDPNTRVLTEALDKNGTLWLSNINLTTYDSATNQFVLSEKVFPQLKFTDQRFQNMVFRDDYMYLQPSNLDNQALYRINLKNYTCDSIAYPKEMIDKKEFNRDRKTFDVVEIDKASNFAYTAYHSSVFQFNLKTRQLKKIISLPDSLKLWEQIFNMSWYKLDDSDHLWIATTKAIHIYEPNRLREIKTINLEKDSYVLQLYNIDGRGIMCILYSGGIILYDYKNNKQFRLSLKDGLISETLNRGIACANNILFVGSYHYMQYIGLDNVLNRNINRKVYLSSIKISDEPYLGDTLPQFLHSISLSHDKNFIQLTFSSTEFEEPEQLEYRYKLDGVNKEWLYTGYLNRTISYNNLKPGNYYFHTSVKNADGTWSDNSNVLKIIVVPAWWQTQLFKVLVALVFMAAIYLFAFWRIKTIRRQEQQKSKYERELLELEAKALRAQMNPHFIFNCMNSIKSLIQKNDSEKAIAYLTTFSKLIRTVFQNSSKREITLYDEVETCRLYTQLESMRFGNKFKYEFNVDETLDLKSVMVPALIMQPFIENAIWHGIMPKEDGGSLKVKVMQDDHAINCIIDDDGIGRETSRQNKFSTADYIHQSKGEHLTQARLDLDNLLNERNAGLKIIDKKNDIDKPAGTTVILSFKED